MTSIKTINPFIILGCTGAGKSKLALQLARHFNGEIISADSMQVYKGLDIVTNKVTKAERDLIPHRLIDFLSPLQTSYNVTLFRNSAVPMIDGLINQGKLPVIVGGTNYYIEALLWKMLVDNNKGSSDIRTGETVKKKACLDMQSPPSVSPKVPPDDFIERNELEETPTRDLYERLIALDPDCRSRYHPNDRRKLVRALEMIDQTGKPVSEIYARQHETSAGGDLSGALRYPDCCVLWVQCQQSVLDERTDTRVDEMIEQGLLKELLDFHQQYNNSRIKENEAADYTRGIFQSIGFKEFHNYLLLPENERETELGVKLLKQGIEDMKTATRQYARKQTRWITNRFIKRRGDNVPLVYAVDSTDVTKWDTNCYQPAVNVVEAWLEGRTSEQPPLPREERQGEPCYHVCHACGGLVFVRTTLLQDHLKGKKHKFALERQRRLEKLKANGESKQSVSDTQSCVSEKLHVATPDLQDCENITEATDTDNTEESSSDTKDGTSHDKCTTEPLLT